LTAEAILVLGGGAVFFHNDLRPLSSTLKAILLEFNLNEARRRGEPLSEEEKKMLLSKKGIKAKIDTWFASATQRLNRAPDDSAAGRDGDDAINNFAASQSPAGGSGFPLSSSDDDDTALVDTPTGTPVKRTGPEQVAFKKNLGASLTTNTPSPHSILSQSPTPEATVSPSKRVSFARKF
jgi:hypothetical protein